MVDSSEHVVLLCKRWEEMRYPLLIRFGVVTAENIVEIMMESNENWSFIERIIDGILRRKDADP